MIAGVCSGVAEYFGIDKSIVRIIWAFLAIFMEPVYWHISLHGLLCRNKNLPVKRPKWKRIFVSIFCFRTFAIKIYFGDGFQNYVLTTNQQETNLKQFSNWWRVFYLEYLTKPYWV